MAVTINKISMDTNIYDVSEMIDKIDVDGVIYNIGINTSDATATVNDVIQGKTFYANNQKLTGVGDSNLIAENIKKGVKIFNVDGEYIPDISVITASGYYTGVNNSQYYYYDPIEGWYLPILMAYTANTTGNISYGLQGSSSKTISVANFKYKNLTYGNRNCIHIEPPIYIKSTDVIYLGLHGENNSLSIALMKI